MFYENNDDDFPIIVSLIVSPANTVTKTKTARSTLAADSAKNGTLFSSAARLTWQQAAVHVSCNVWICLPGVLLKHTQKKKRQNIHADRKKINKFISKIFHLCFQNRDGKEWDEGCGAEKQKIVGAEPYTLISPLDIIIIIIIETLALEAQPWMVHPLNADAKGQT